MSIKELLETIKTLNPDEILDSDFTSSVISTKPSLSASDIRRISKHISKFRENSPSYTLNCILLYSIWDSDQALECARKKGVFRYKAWGFEQNIVLNLLKQLQKFEEKLNFSESSKQFIQCKIELCWLFDFYKNTEHQIKSTILDYHRKRYVNKCYLPPIEEGLFKDLLVYVDILFHNGQYLYDPNNKHIINGYSIEEISESVSYIIFLYEELVGIKKEIQYVVNPDYVYSKEIENLILLGCKVCQIQEWEICVDYFDYTLRKTDRNYVIHSKDDNFEKSIRLGYSRNHMQNAIFQMDCEKAFKNDKGINDFANLILNESTIPLVEKVGSGKALRYRFLLPEKCFEAFSTDEKTLFKEELIELNRFCKNTGLNLDEVQTKKITDTCTLYDIILFKRIFILFDKIFLAALFKQKDRKLIASSLIPQFEKEILINLISTYFLKSRTKVEELLKLFTYEKSFKLDLQYTPILQVGNKLIFSPSIISNSNLLRNSIEYSYLSKNTIANNTNDEELVAICKKTFERHQEYTVFANRKYKYNQQSGEIDVLVVSNNDIIIIECKSPLEPTSNFEIRATYDHITKATKQLDLLNQAFNDKSFCERYLKGLGVDYRERTVHTCIIMGNRLFNGYTFNSHPIRYISDLDMILNNGYVYSNVGDWRIWKNTSFSNADLIDFLSQDYKFSKANYDSAQKRYEQIRIDGKVLMFETYQINPQKLCEEYDKYFPKTPPTRYKPESNKS